MRGWIAVLAIASEMLQNINMLLGGCVLRLIVILLPGEAYMRLSKLPEAEHWYMESLRAKTDHIPAHLTYGKLLALTVSNCPHPLQTGSLCADSRRWGLRYWLLASYHRW